MNAIQILNFSSKSWDMALSKTPFIDDMKIENQDRISLIKSPGKTRTMYATYHRYNNVYIHHYFSS